MSAQSTLRGCYESCSLPATDGAGGNAVLLRQMTDGVERHGVLLEIDFRKVPPL